MFLTLKLGRKLKHTKVYQVMNSFGFQAENPAFEKRI